MAIPDTATPKDYSTVIYSKTEIDAMELAETTRVDAQLDLKSLKADEGSPSGIATLDATGKVSLVELPTASDAQAIDDTNVSNILTPSNLDYVLQVKDYISTTDSHTAFGNLESDGSKTMDANYAPQASTDIATVAYVQTVASSNTTTYVVGTQVEMLALDPIIIGDRCFITADGVNNGEYLATAASTGGSVIGDWELKTDIASWGTILGTLSNQTDLQNALDLKATTSTTDAIELKTDFISVTQAVDLDVMETNSDTSKVITDHITVTSATDLDTMRTDVSNSKTTTDFITATEAVNLDTHTSDISSIDGRVTTLEGSHGLVLNAFSLATSQQPSALDTPLQVEFGTAQSNVDVSIDVNGVITFNTAGTYMLNFKFQYGRSGSVGTSILLFRVLLDGSQIGYTQAAKIDNADISVPWSSTDFITVTAGQTLTTEIVRDGSGNNSGGAIALDPSLIGWGTAPCAAVTIHKN